jgi:amino acid transporter
MHSIVEKAKEDAEDDGPKLSLLDLLSIGIGCTVGSGIFVLTSSVLPIAGPSAAIGWLGAGCASLLSAYSYMELTSAIPTKGSTYVFAYHCLGELPAVIASVCLTLEYGVSGAGVAQGWSSKMAALIGPAFPFPVQKDATGLQFDVVAAVLQLLCVLVVLGGLRLVKAVTNFFTVVKVLLIVFMIVAGFMCYSNNIFESYDTFFPEGVGGTVTATSLLFFGFIGTPSVRRGAPGGFIYYCYCYCC